MYSSLTYHFLNNENVTFMRFLKNSTLFKTILIAYTSVVFNVTSLKEMYPNFQKKAFKLSQLKSSIININAYNNEDIHRSSHQSFIIKISAQTLVKNFSRSSIIILNRSLIQHKAEGKKQLRKHI